MDRCIRKHSTTISRNLGLSSPNEIVYGRDSCMSCSMHKIRSCAHTLRRDQEKRDASRSEIGMWKKLFKGWTVLLKFGVRRRGGQRKGGLQAGGAGEQVDIGIGAERRI